MLKPSASPLTDVQDGWIVADKLIPPKAEEVKFLFRPSAARKAELQRTYDRLVARARGREKIKGVHERHHIRPVALGGDNSKNNLVYLTYKEHFIAHWLLVLVNNGEERRKMLHALRQMTRKSKKMGTRIFSGWQYELARKAVSEAQTGVILSEKTINKIRIKQTNKKYSKETNAKKGRKGHRPTEETCVKISFSKKGSAHTDDTCATLSRMKKNWYTQPGNINKISGNNNGMYGRQNNQRRVRCINDGREFESIKDASEFYGINKTLIGVVCRKKQTHTGGFTFEYVDEKPILGGKRVICINDGNQFSSASEASRFYNLSGVDRVCRGRRRQVGGLVFRYAN